MLGANGVSGLLQSNGAFELAVPLGALPPLEMFEISGFTSFIYTSFFPGLTLILNLKCILFHVFTGWILNIV